MKVYNRSLEGIKNSLESKGPMGKETEVVKGNGNGVFSKIALQLGCAIIVGLIGIFIYGYNKIDSLSVKVSMLETRAALADERVKVMEDRLLMDLEKHEMFVSQINELKLSVSQCKQIKNRIRKQLED